MALWGKPAWCYDGLEHSATTNDLYVQAVQLDTNYRHSIIFSVATSNCAVRIGQ